MDPKNKVGQNIPHKIESDVKKNQNQGSNEKIQKGSMKQEQTISL